MQKELDLATPGIQLNGVNETGHESGNAETCAGKTLPWLQDNVVQNVWTLWGVTYRDAIILDAQNRVVGVYNLTAHDLNVPANYDELKAMLLAARGP
ncbi:MAG: hypothetical protein ACT4PV_10560 [Planctomycetaceae bacterium]